MGRKPEGKAEKLFKSLGKNVDSFISDIKDSEKLNRLNINERVAEIAKNKQTIEHHMSDFSHNAKSQWNNAKPNLERAGQELRKAINTMFSKQVYR